MISLDAMTKTKQVKCGDELISNNHDLSATAVLREAVFSHHELMAPSSGPSTRSPLDVVDHVTSVNVARKRFCEKPNHFQWSVDPSTT